MNTTSLGLCKKAAIIIATGLALAGTMSARADDAQTTTPRVVRFGKFLTDSDQVVLRGFTGELKDVKVLCGLMGGEYAGKRCFTGRPYCEERSADGKTYECQIQSWCGSTAHLRGAYLILTQADNGDVSIRCEWVRYRNAGTDVELGVDMRKKYANTWKPGSSWTSGCYAAGFVLLGINGGTVEPEPFSDAYVGPRTVHKAALKTVPYQKYERLFPNTRLADVVSIRATTCMVYADKKPFVKADTTKFVPAGEKLEGYDGNEGFYFVERDECKMTFQVQVHDGVTYTSGTPLCGGMFVDLVQQGDDVYGCVYDVSYVYHKGTYGDDYSKIKSQNTTYYCTDEEDETTMTRASHGVIRFSLRDLQLKTKGRDAAAPNEDTVRFDGFVEDGKTVVHWLPTNLSNFHALRCSVSGGSVSQKGKVPRIYEGKAYFENYDAENNVYSCQMQMKDPDCDGYLRGIGLTFTQETNGNVIAHVGWVKYLSNSKLGDDVSSGTAGTLSTSHTAKGYAFSDFVFSNVPEEKIADAPIEAYEGELLAKKCAAKTVPFKNYGLLFKDTRLADVVQMEATACVTYQANSFLTPTVSTIYAAKPATGGDGFYFAERTAYGDAARMTFQVQVKDSVHYTSPLMGCMFVDLVQLGNDVYGQVTSVRYLAGKADYGTNCRTIGTQNKVMYYLDGEDETVAGDDYGVMRFSLRDLKLKVPSAEPPFEGTDWVGGAAGDWNVADNWSTGAVPTADDNVRIYNGGDSVSIAVTSDATAASVSIRTDTTLTGSGTFANYTIGTNSTLTLNVTGTSTLKNVSGGTLVKTGAGDLKAVDGNGSTLNGTKVIVNEGRIWFNTYGGATVHLTDPTFVIGENGDVENYGWFYVYGTMTIENDTNKEIFTNSGASSGDRRNAYLQGNPKVVKNGAGILTLSAALCGADSKASHTSDIVINAGRLYFGSGRAYTLDGVISGNGAAGVKTRDLTTTVTFSAANMFTGGFYAVKGVAKSGNATSFGPVSTKPADTSSVYVLKDGTLDLNDAADKTYTIYSEGTVQSSKARDATNYRQLADFVLTGDTLVAKKRFGMLGPSWGPTRLNLNDHTMTIDMDSISEGFYIGNTTISGTGTIDVKTGYLSVAKSKSTAPDATIIIRSGAKLTLPYTLSAKNLVLEDGALVGNTAMLTVTGELMPGAPAVNLTLADTATIRFPEGLPPSKKLTLCTGTLAVGEGFKTQNVTFYVGDQPVTGDLVIDKTDNTIRYRIPGIMMFVK